MYGQVLCRRFDPSRGLQYLGLACPAHDHSATVSQLQLHFRQRLCVVEGSEVGLSVWCRDVGWAIDLRMDIIR